MGTPESAHGDPPGEGGTWEAARSPWMAPGEWPCSLCTRGHEEVPPATCDQDTGPHLVTGPWRPTASSGSALSGRQSMGKKAVAQQAGEGQWRDGFLEWREEPRWVHQGHLPWPPPTAPCTVSRGTPGSSRPRERRSWLEGAADPTPGARSQSHSAFPPVAACAARRLCPAVTLLLLSGRFWEEAASCRLRGADQEQWQGHLASQPSPTTEHSVQEGRQENACRSGPGLLGLGP